jgi:Raf kinase inhibitor-like YbhB/YbcL family protein
MPFSFTKKRSIVRLGAVALAAATSVFALSANALELSSADIGEGKLLASAQVFNGFGCEGGNRSPELKWSDVPAGTKSFAVTVYDPDAPTGSGWWHWVVYDIPAAAHGLPGGAGVATMPASQGRQARTDYGTKAFGGACPPAGDKPHRYIFTVYALKTPKLGVPEDASPALIGFMLRDQVLARATITAQYSR